MTTIDQTLLDLQKAIDTFDSKAVTSASTQLIDLMNASLAEHPEQFCRALKECVDEFDSDRTSELCSQLASHLQTRDEPYPKECAEKILITLRRKQLFAKMISVADKLQQLGNNEHVISKCYAQALIDSGHYSSAIAVLTQLAAACIADNTTKELAEANGLLGRAYKQIYINAAASGNTPGLIAKNALEQSFNYYYTQYRSDTEKYSWHGINAVAIQHRAQLDDIEISDLDTAKASTDILTHINKTQTTELWSMAIAAEACLAVEDYPAVLGWLKKYLDEKYVKSGESDAFEVGSTLRQFEEVWQLNEDHPDQSPILQVLRAAMLKRNGGTISLKHPQNALKTINDTLCNKSFEAILGNERFKNLRWLKKGFERAQGVCKFIDNYGDAFGTGFLIESKALNLSIGNKWVVLTNSHVISNNEMEQRGTPKAKPPEKARVQFEAGTEPNREFEIGRIIAWSPRDELDYCVLTLTEEGAFTASYSIANALPLIDNDQRIYLIGHPRGGKLSFSFYDNKLLDHDEEKIHYRSPSEGGSSGSPVFNAEWDLIGLHHAGGKEIKKLRGQPGTYAANEGLWIKSIISSIDSKNCV